MQNSILIKPCTVLEKKLNHFYQIMGKLNELCHKKILAEVRCLMFVTDVCHLRISRRAPSGPGGEGEGTPNLFRNSLNCANKFLNEFKKDPF